MVMISGEVLRLLVRGGLQGKKVTENIVMLLLAVAGGVAFLSLFGSAL